MEACCRLEPQTLPATATNEPRDLVDRRNAGTAAAQFRLALAEHSVALALLMALDNSKWLRATNFDMFCSDDEAVRKPGVVGPADAAPLRERFVERKLGRREHARVVPQAPEERPPRVALRNGW